MSNTVLLKDNVIAFTAYPQNDAMQLNEWPDDALWTRFGYLIPFDYDSGQIIEYLEVGPEKFVVPLRSVHEAGAGKDFNPQAMLITRDAKVYHLRLIYPPAGQADGLGLSVKRVLSGAGAKFVMSDGMAEHDRAFLCMKLTTNMDEALDLFERNTAATQFTYKLVKIDVIAKALRQRWQMPLTKLVTIKPKVTVEVKPNFVE